MSAQVISSPQKIQNHGFFGFLMINLVTLGFLAANGYHGATALYYKYYNPAVDNWIQATMAGAVGVLISFFEMFIAVLLIKSIRLKDPWPVQMFWTFVMAVTVIMATQLGTMSQGGTQEMKENSIQSNQAQTSGIGYQKDAALARKEQLYAHASSCSNCDPDKIRMSADRQYSKKMATLSTQEADLISKRPVTQDTGFENAIDKQELNLLLAFFCSIAGATMVVYKQMFYQSYMRTVEVSLLNKKGLDWDIEKDNFKSETFSVNPLKGISTLGFLGKVNPKQVKPINDEAHPAAQPKAKQEAPKKPRTLFAECPECSSVFKITSDDLTSHKQSKLRCGECSHVFVGSDHLTDRPAPTKKESEVNADQNELPSADTLDWLDGAEVDDYLGVPIVLRSTEQNFADPARFDVAILTPDNAKVLYSSFAKSENEWLNRIENRNLLGTKYFLKACKDYKALAAQQSTAKAPLNSGLTDDSQGLTQQKQQFKANGNPRETSENTGETDSVKRGKTAPKAISGEFIKAEKPQSDYAQHFADVAKIQDHDAKLAALAGVIDTLSNDPAHHGAAFSASAIRRQIGGRYEPVKQVFLQKLAEGKLAQKGSRSPYTIVHVGNTVRHENLDQHQVPGTRA